MNLVSPVTKNKKGTVIHSGRRQCAVNIYKSVRTENPLMSKDEVVKRTAEFSGISKRSIYRIISEYQTNKTTKSPKNKKPRSTIAESIDDFTKTAIRRKIHDFFFKTNRLHWQKF